MKAINMLQYYVQKCREEGIDDESIKKVVYDTVDEINKRLRKPTNVVWRYIDVLKHHHDLMMQERKNNQSLSNDNVALSDNNMPVSDDNQHLSINNEVMDKNWKL